MGYRRGVRMAKEHMDMVIDMDMDIDLHGDMDMNTASAFPATCSNCCVGAAVDTPLA